MQFLLLLITLVCIFSWPPGPDLCLPEPVITTDIDRRRIKSLVDKLDDCDFRVREKATEALLLEPWERLKVLLPTEGSPEKIIRIKRIERNANAEMKLWYKEASASSDTLSKYDFRRMDGAIFWNSFWKRWIDIRPPSIFDKEKESPNVNKLLPNPE